MKTNITEKDMNYAAHYSGKSIKKDYFFILFGY